MVRRWRAWPLLLVGGLGCGDDLPTTVTTSSSTGADSGTTAQTSGSTSDAPSTTTGGSSGSTGSTSVFGSSSGSAESTSASSTTAESSSGGTGSSGSTGSSGGTGSESGTSAGSSGSGEESGSTGDPPPPVCIDQDLGGALVTVFGDTSLAADDWAPPCAPGVGGSDRGHLFTAPADGFFAFDTLGTGFDTVLYAFDGAACGGPVLGCNDDVQLGVSQSRISMYLTAGSPLVLMVDGYDDTQAGPYALDIDAVLGPCHQIDLGSALPAQGLADNTLAQDKLDGSCVPLPGRDVVFRWQAPVDGAYVIDTVGTAFDAVLYVRSPDCGVADLACNDDGAGGGQAELLLPLAAGDELTLVVDGYAMDDVGAVVLNIAAL